MEDDVELCTVTLDVDLKAQAEEMIRPMGITLEQLIVKFIYWCISNPQQAIAYLKSAQEEQGKELRHD